MSKRSLDKDEDHRDALKRGERPNDLNNVEDEVGPFEDDHEDEFESDDEIMEAGVDGRPDSERLKEEEEQGEQMDIDKETFIPGRTAIPQGESLAPDLSTYDLLHTLQASWPCLSFDILKDNLGDGRARRKYPATVYAVAGTQAAAGHDKENELLVMKMSRLGKMDRPEDSDEESDDNEDNEDDIGIDPVLESKTIRLSSCTNRIRSCQRLQPDPTLPHRTLTASMLETGQVPIHDITPHITALDTPGYVLHPSHAKPIHTIANHKTKEGFALDWSPVTHVNSALRLVTGDSAGQIFLTTCDESGKFSTDAKPFLGHNNSVEELHWAPYENTVFASASSDSSIRIWDTRSKAHKPSLSMKVSDVDVNVLSWSAHANTSHLLATGADDGTWSLWDLRSWKSSSSQPGVHKVAAPQVPPIASFNFHKEQITSLEWHPTDDSVIAVASGDNTITLWDLSVEHDDEESRYTADVKDVPPQLLFVHYMEEVKECHWHPQQDGLIMATGGSGFGYVVEPNTRGSLVLALADVNPAESLKRLAFKLEA